MNANEHNMWQMTFPNHSILHDLCPLQLQHGQFWLDAQFSEKKFPWIFWEKKKYSVIRSEQLRLSRDIVKFTEHERNYLNYSIQLMTERIKEVEKCVHNPFILKQTCFCQSIATTQGIKKKLWSSLLFISKSR